MNGYNLGNGLTLKPRGDPAPENYDLVTPKMTETFLIATLEGKIHGGAYAICGSAVVLVAVHPQNSCSTP